MKEEEVEELKCRGMYVCTLGSIKATMHSRKLPEVSDLSSCMRSWRRRGRRIEGINRVCNNIQQPLDGLIHSVCL